MLKFIIIIIIIIIIITILLQVSFRNIEYNNYNIVFKGITLREALDIVNDNFTNELDDQCETVDFVVPPDPDSLTYLNEEPDDSAGRVNAKDVPGLVEVNFTDSQNADLVPEMTSCRPKKSTKRQKLYSQAARFEKCKHNYKKIAQNDHV